MGWEVCQVCWSPHLATGAGHFGGVKKCFYAFCMGSGNSVNQIANLSVLIMRQMFASINMSGFYLIFFWRIVFYFFTLNKPQQVIRAENMLLFLLGVGRQVVLQG